MNPTIKLMSPGGADIYVAVAHITQIVGQRRSSTANYEATVHTVDGKSVEVSQRPEEIARMMKEVCE